MPQTKSQKLHQKERERDERKERQQMGEATLKISVQPRQMNNQTHTNKMEQKKKL